jgi:transcriptional regulator with PAS, ATPase and Fis domain
MPDPFIDLPKAAKVEARYIRYLLKQFDGNRTQVARVMGVSRSTLWRKMRAYNIR